MRHLRKLVEPRPQFVHHPAERMFAVGGPHWAKLRSGNCFTAFNCPLCANDQVRPQSSRVNGCVFSSATRPRLARRTCAMTMRLLIGRSRTNCAKGELAL